MFYLYLKDKHTDKSGAESNAVQINADYWKNSGGVVLQIIGVEHTKGDPPGQFSYMPIGSPKASHIWQKCARNPGKNGMPKILADIKGQIEGREGPAWDHLEAFLKAQGMTLEGETITTKNPDAAAG